MHKRFVRPSGEDDQQGVLPDHSVLEHDRAAAASGDQVLEYTKALIQARIKSNDA
jgi:hypothetical protein